jgi:hypothetical protein
MIAYNKVTREWASTTDGSELSADWILDPVFVDRAHADALGPEFWTFDGNTIDTVSQASYDATMKHRAQVQKWAEIQAERDRRKYAGTNVDGNWFHSDDASRIQQIGLVMLGANLPAIQWKTMSGAYVTMTPTLASQIFQTRASADVAIFTVAEQHRNAMLAAEDPDSYDFSANWPVVYE